MRVAGIAWTEISVGCIADGDYRCPWRLEFHKTARIRRGDVGGEIGN